MRSLLKGINCLLKGIKTLAIVCFQWGDSGKGKIVDFFAEWADIIARGTGGANAGHTIVLNGKQYIFHLIPCGILFDKEGKTNVLGNGMVIDPDVLIHELDILDHERLTYDHVLISHNAKLILPQHFVIETIRESVSEGKIGTTGRGIGPAYEDHYGRIGLTLNDMLNPDIFAKKLKRNLRDKIIFLRQFDPEVTKAVLHKPRLLDGQYWNPETIFDVEAIVEQYVTYAKRFGHLIDDADEFIRRTVGQSNILLEGAQGTLLSIDYGTYPYVTSSDCSIRGLARGVGLSERHVDYVLGIVKAFYMTRVGEGPFPTEIGGKESEDWCSKDGITKDAEFDKYAPLSVNEKDTFQQGIAIRMQGNEYGATTGRPRRVGWLDLPLLRLAVGINGSDAILTKVDILSGCDEIKICTHYSYNGPKMQLGRHVLGDTKRIIDRAIPDSDILRNCTPHYKSFPGWKRPLENIKQYADLPDNLKTILDFVAQEGGIRPRIISVGPDRNQTIMVE